MKNKLVLMMSLLLNNEIVKGIIRIRGTFHVSLL